MQTASRQGRSASRTCGRRDGAAALEFVLILPLMFVLILGAIDFGRFAHSLIAVTSASRAGAGFASNNGTTNATLASWKVQVRAAVLAELSQTLPDTGLVANDVITTIPAPTITGTASSTRKLVSVTVSIPFRTVISWPLMPENATLTRTTVFRGIY